MATDFAAEGLLDGLDGEARTAREDLLRVLEEEGVSLGDVRSASNDGRLMFLLAERAVGGVPRYTAREVAEESGLPLERLMSLRRAQGVPRPGPRRPRALEHRPRRRAQREGLRGAGTCPSSSSSPSCECSGAA